MMPKSEQQEETVDWSLTTWEGARHEELRKWSQLPLEKVILALEEMADISHTLHGMDSSNHGS